MEPTRTTNDPIPQIGDLVWYRENGEDPEQFEVLAISTDAGRRYYLLAGIDGFVSETFIKS